MGILKYFLLILILLFACPVWATNYWVSPTGAATWANCSGETPLEGTAACSLYTANQNADDDDVVNMRAGTYYIGTTTDTGDGHDASHLSPGIVPTKSGSSGHVITWKPYDTEVVYFLGGADIGVYSYGIWINAKSYIKVTGNACAAGTCNLKLEKMRANVIIGPATGQNPTGNSEYNEVSYVHVYNSGVPGWTSWWQGSVVWKSSNYNHIHHCIFEKHGYQAFPVTQCEGLDNPNGCCTGLDEGATCSANGIDNEGSVFDVGAETDATYGTMYNVIENNEFMHGGHNTLSVFGKYNIIRNNYLHNEEWSEFEGILYGYRNIITTGKEDYTGYNVFEGNRIGYAGENAQVGNQGGGGTKLATPYNIFRYNSLFGNKGMALYISTYAGYSSARYNSIYNNTFYYNGYYSVPTTNVDPVVWQCQSTESCWSTTLPGNVFKNNLFYNNRRTPWYNWLYGGTYTLLTTYNTIANNYEASSNPFADADAIDVSDPTSATKPTLLLSSTESAIDYNPVGDYGYLTTATKKDDNTMTFADARYFQDGSFGTGSALAWPSSVTIAADYVCFSTTKNASGCTNKQIGAINYSTGDVTITGHGLAAETTYYVWLYKKSDGTQVLYGNGSDAGAHEYDNSGTPPVYTVTISGTGAGCSATHSSAYEVTSGNTLNVGLTINNGWQNTWSGTCPSTGTTSRVCTPTEDDQTMVYTCTEIKVFPW